MSGSCFARVLTLMSLACSLGAWSAAGAADLACADRYVAASAVRTPTDVQAFVNCAYEYVIETGEAEAYRAFHNDERWKSGAIYVFVLESVPSSSDSTVFVHPFRTDVEGGTFGNLTDEFGGDFIANGVRIVQAYGSGFWYYSFTDPATLLTEPKVSYLRDIDWNGTRAVIGSGVYLRDLPGSCNSGDVNAAGLAAAPSERTLQEFVRCAAFKVGEQGYFAKEELRRDSRWHSGPSYVFGLDSNGNQWLSGRGIAVNGVPLHEWASLGDQFGGRDVLAAAEAFGEVFLYYRTLNPATGRVERKVSFLKRVLSLGVPVLVGAGYYVEDCASCATAPVPGVPGAPVVPPMAVLIDSGYLPKN